MVSSSIELGGHALLEAVEHAKCGWTTTLLLGGGVHPKIVADLLGHSTTAVTNDVYSHVTPTMQQVAVDALEGLLPEHH